MKRLLVAFALVLALLVAGVPTAGAAPAYTTQWAVSITYQNTGLAPAQVSFTFYSEGSGSPILVSAPNLAVNASNSLSIAQVSQLTSSFKGSAVLSSDQPVVATLVQFDPSRAVRNRPLSNGFSAADASTKQLIATVLKNSGNHSTYFSIQNTETSNINVTVSFYRPGQAAAVATLPINNLPPNAAKYVDVKDIAQLPNGFSGSAIVTARIAGTNTAAATVVTVDELQVNGNSAKSFEGSPKSGAKVYMPTAACQAPSGTNTVNSAYAIQNADQVNNVTFRVVYKIPGRADIVDGPFTVAGGGKQSVLGCAKLPAGSLGSAVIERTGGQGTLVAVGKINGTNNSITSAFLGIVQGEGSAKIALPYVRYSPQDKFLAGSQRTFIAVQNIGTTAATNVVVQYIDKDGKVKGQHVIGNIPAGEKRSSNATQAPGAIDVCGRFGEYDQPGAPTCSGGVFGGGAIVTAGSGAQLAVVARVQSGPTAGEDYNGINVE